MIARLGRRRTRPEAVLRRFTARLGPPVAAGELLLQVAEALKTSLRAARAEVWVVDGDRVERAVSVRHIGEGDHVDIGARERRQLTRPDLYGTAWARVWLPSLLDGRGACSLRIAPLVNDGELLGLVVVERPADRDDFSTAEGAMLTELARHLGLSLHNERLRLALEATLADVRRANEELRASRARIVETADAERRRIERDLHDGAQQQLIALAIDLRRARAALPEDTASAAIRLEQASAAAAAAIDELADLAHGIYPPVLRDSGLVAALRVAARRHRSDLRLEVSGLARQPAAVEAAIYFAVVEAMQNAAKHAPGAAVTVTVADDDDTVTFEVADDGPGFDVQTARRGQGMLNIMDRIGALGGSVRWESSPGAGAKMRGALPTAGDGQST